MHTQKFSVGGSIRYNKETGTRPAGLASQQFEETLWVRGQNVPSPLVLGWKIGVLVFCYRITNYHNLSN